jgi:hypothetical protein
MDHVACAEMDDLRDRTVRVGSPQMKHLFGRERLLRKSMLA